MHPLAVTVLAMLVVASGACGSGSSPTELTVFAAASLTESFGALAEEFEGEHAGVEVTINLAGSQQLAGQILAGAGADVFASANPVQMQRVQDAGLVAGPPAVFAHNGLVIAVEPDNPHGIAGLDDLGRSGLTVVLPAPQVPAGVYARTALAAAGVNVQPSSLEPDVRAALSRVALGEADATIAYRTDITSERGAQSVAIDPEFDVRAVYPIAVLRDAPNRGRARDFISFVLSPEGQAVLRAHGFLVDGPDPSATATR